MYRFAFVPNRLGIYVDHLTLDVPFSRTYVFKNSFFVRICRLWNELPLTMRVKYLVNLS